MRTVLHIALLALLITTTPLFAQPEKGDKELQLQASLSIGVKGDAENTGTFAMNWGRYFSERQEAGVSVVGFFDDDGELSGFGGPFYRYNFSTGRTVPYVGAAAGTTFGTSNNGNNIQVNFEGGVRWFLQRNTAISLAGTYLYDVDESEFADSLQVLFGFSYFWSKH